MKNLFKINIFTYIFLILSMLSGFFREIILIFFILVVHEMGHFFLMKLNLIEIKSITIYPYGGMIKSNMLINTNSLKVLIISLGGILSQLMLWLIFFISYKVGIIDLSFYNIFFKYNISIIIFNLIPIYPLDGFKILNSFFELIFSFKKSLYISFIISIVCLLFFIFYLYLFKISNYVIVIFLIISLIEYLKSFKYLINKFYIERIIYDINYKGLKSVKSLNDLKKNNFNYINGIGEKVYLEKFYR